MIDSLHFSANIVHNYQKFITFKIFLKPTYNKQFQDTKLQNITSFMSMWSHYLSWLSVTLHKGANMGINVLLPQ
jgi:hypothetical protein